MRGGTPLRWFGSSAEHGMCWSTWSESATWNLNPVSIPSRSDHSHPASATNKCSTTVQSSHYNDHNLSSSQPCNSGGEESRLLVWRRRVMFVYCRIVSELFLFVGLLWLLMCCKWTIRPRLIKCGRVGQKDRVRQLGAVEWNTNY